MTETISQVREKIMGKKIAYIILKQGSNLTSKIFNLTFFQINLLLYWQVIRNLNMILIKGICSINGYLHLYIKMSSEKSFYLTYGLKFVLLNMTFNCFKFMKYECCDFKKDLRYCIFLSMLVYIHADMI